MIFRFKYSASNWIPRRCMLISFWSIISFISIITSNIVAIWNT
ncbi:hypothetical protein [Methanobrevibacter boviskoreani]|nr:hypothetical protein [Methanobrevibacter boviskoreani]